MSNKYRAEDIEVLTGLEPVKRRPGMYTDTTRPNHLAMEVIDNSVDEALAGRDYLIGDFSGADIMLGHALYMSRRLGAVSEDLTNLNAYIDRIEARPAFQKGIQA